MGAVPSRSMEQVSYEGWASENLAEAGSGESIGRMLRASLRSRFGFENFVSLVGADFGTSPLVPPSLLNTQIFLTSLK